MEQKNVPELRFKGFSGDWERKRLGDVATFYSGLTYSPSNVISGGGTLVLRSSNVKNDEVINADNVYVSSEVVNSDNVQINDIIVVVRNGSRSLIGKHAQIKKPMKDTVIGAFMTGVRYEYSAFLNVLLNTQQFDNEMAKNMGATINQITTGAFKEMQFIFPKSTAEQTCIGDFFRHLDSLITLRQQKHDKLVTLKKAMLSKMFPQEGEVVPEVRFAGFSGDWERKKLGEVGYIVGGGTPSTSIEEYWHGDIDWYAPAEINGQIFVSSSQKKITELGLQKSSATVLPIGTVLFTSRAGIGKSAILAKKGATNQGFQSIVPYSNELNSYFVFSRTYELKRYAETVGAGSTFVEVSGKQLSEMPLLIPSLTEQTAIGNFFQNLDNLITLQSKELEKLKNIKKSLLDKMFV